MPLEVGRGQNLKRQRLTDFSRFWLNFYHWGHPCLINTSWMLSIIAGFAAVFHNYILFSQEVQELFDKLDSDKDGRVSFDDFVGGLFQHHSSVDQLPNSRTVTPLALGGSNSRVATPCKLTPRTPSAQRKVKAPSAASDDRQLPRWFVLVEHRDCFLPLILTIQGLYIRNQYVNGMKYNLQLVYINSYR